SIAYGGETRRMTDSSNAGEVEAVSEDWVLAIEPCHLVHHELKVAAVVVHDLSGRMELVFASGGDFAAGQRDTTHVRVIYTENGISPAGQVLSDGRVAGARLFPTMREQHDGRTMSRKGWSVQVRMSLCMGRGQEGGFLPDSPIRIQTWNV